MLLYTVYNHEDLLSKIYNGALNANKFPPSLITIMDNGDQCICSWALTNTFYSH